MEHWSWCCSARTTPPVWTYCVLRFKKKKKVTPCSTFQRYKHICHVVPFCAVFSFLFWSGIFCWPSLDFNKGPVRVPIGLQSLCFWSFSVWYFLYLVVLSLHYAQHSSWCILSKRKYWSVHVWVFCTPQFQDSPSSFSKAAQSRNVRFAAIHLAPLN